MRAITHQTFTVAPARGSYSVQAKSSVAAAEAAAELRKGDGLDEMVVAVYCAARDTFEVHRLTRPLGVWRVIETRSMTDHERDHGVRAWG